MNHKKNILFVVHRVPYPPDRGDRIRSFHLLKYLSERANVWLATLADEDLKSQSLTELQSYCEEVTVEKLSPARYLHGVVQLCSGHSATEGLFYSGKLKKTIKRWTRDIEFDAVLGFCSSVAPYLTIPELEDIPKYVDLVDVDSEKFFEYSASNSGVKGLLYNLEAQRLRELEIRLGHDCQGVTFVTKPESEIYRAFMPAANIHYATNGIDLDYFNHHGKRGNSCENSTNNQGSEKSCLFVGALDYPPNIEGIKWFCNHVWDQIISRYPEATLSIVGRNPVQEVTDLHGHKNIYVHSNVPDVRPYYRDAVVAIAPLKIARGLQNKVLEAFAMQVPVIGTPYAMEGISLNQENALIASTEEEWVDQLSHLLNHDQVRESYSQAGYEFVKKHHSWEACLQPFSELLKI